MSQNLFYQIGVYNSKTSFPKFKVDTMVDFLTNHPVLYSFDQPNFGLIVQLNNIMKYYVA